jgi:hypothetical protein
LNMGREAKEYAKGELSPEKRLNRLENLFIEISKSIHEKR